jgi:D-amino-acid dehydrogenase
MQKLTERLKRSAVKIQEGIEVSAIKADRVITSAGEIAADLTVVAAGAWSGTLCRTIGIRLPLLGGKGYGFTLPDLPAVPQLPGILVEARVAYNPVPEGLRFVGAMELGPPVLPPDDDRRIAGMRTAITAAFPQLHQVSFPAEVWSGMRPCSPDGLPYVGRLTRAPNCIVATGHGMMGMSLGPITGHLVGEIAANQKPSIPLDLLNPERYA